MSALQSKKFHFFQTLPPGQERTFSPTTSSLLSFSSLFLEKRGFVGSPRRLKLIEHLWLHAQRYQTLSVELRDDVGDSEHRGIIGALRQGDHALAGDLLGDHLKTTIDLINREYSGRRGAPHADAPTP